MFLCNDPVTKKLIHENVHFVSFTNILEQIKQVTNAVLSGF